MGGGGGGGSCDQNNTTPWGHACSSTPEASLVSGPGGNECHCDYSNTSIVHAPLLYGGVEDPCLSFTLFHFFPLLSLPLLLSS